MKHISFLQLIWRFYQSYFFYNLHSRDNNEFPGAYVHLLKDKLHHLQSQHFDYFIITATHRTVMFRFSFLQLQLSRFNTFPNYI